MAEERTGGRGFAALDAARRQEIAGQGGRAAHRKGAAHRFTREEAQAAGRKGGVAKAIRRRQREAAYGDES